MDESLAASVKVPEEIKGLFKVNITVPSDRVETVLQLLYENTTDIPIRGKVLSDLDSEESTDFPRVVLYLDDPSMHFVPELALQLSHMLEEELGEDTFTSQTLDMAFRAGPYVSISQGFLYHKDQFRNQNHTQFERLYGLGGAIYADNVKIFEENFIRAANQIELYEQLIEYTGMPLQERIEALQKAIMRGLPVHFGTRTRDVRMGGQDKALEEKYADSFTYVPADYYPPS